MSSIYVVPIHLARSFLLNALREKIHTIFHLETQTYIPSIDPAFAFDHSRKQYNSSLLLAKLVETKPSDGLRILGVTDLDLFVPILTFVFGEAQLNGPAAIVSIHRLANEFYGLPKNDTKLQERLEKEAVHELGHTFGLHHCRNDRCVMNTSTYAENIDIKPFTFCQSCLKLYNEWLRSVST